MNQRWVVLQQLTCLAPHITVMHNSGQSKKLMYIVYLSFLYGSQTLPHFPTPTVYVV